MSVRRAAYLVGAGPLARRVPGWAREAGLAVVATDRDPRAPGLARADAAAALSGDDVAANLAFARSLRGRFELACVYCGGEFGVETARAVAEAAGLPAPERAAVARALDKRAMGEAFRATGVPTPAGAPAGDAAALRARLEREGPLVLKPAGGSGSRGVRVVAPGDDVAAALAACAAAAPGEVVAEPFLAGRSIDANGCFLGGRYVPCGTLEKRPSPLPDRLPLAGDDPAALPPAEAAAVHALLERGARALGLDVGPVKGDLLRTADGWRLLEVAPRFHGDVTTANTLPFGSGVNPMRLLFRHAATGEVADGEVAGRPGSAAAWRVLPLPPGRVRRLPPPPELGPDPPPAEERPRLTLVWHHPRLAAGARLGRYADTTRIPGYVAARGGSRAEAEAALDAWLADAGYAVDPDPAEAAWFSRAWDAVRSPVEPEAAPDRP